METIRHLREFLADSFPEDLLMPIVEGTKQPMFKHKDGAWSWAAFDEHLKNKGKPGGLCVVLNGLCVVDVDDVTLADELESKFPVLKTAPRENTMRGAHYWFVRSSLADSMGYFDGAAQRLPHVDFKSVCATGTGGIVVVAPSKNKRWVRPLWSTPVVDIPDCLLEAIAAPYRGFVSATLSFADRTKEEVINNRWIRKMAYFEPFFDGAFGTDDIPVPCTKAEFVELMRILELRELVVRDPTTEFFTSMALTADKLGLDAGVFGRALYRLPLLQFDIYNTQQEWWHAHHDETEWRMAGARDDTIIVPVDAALARELCFVPVQQDERWLFHGTSPAHDIRPGQPMLVEDPSAACDTFPEVVKTLLRMHPGTLVLAGGAVLGTVCPYAEAGADFDLFVVGLNPENATRLLDGIRSFFDRTARVVRTGRALTLVLDDDTVVQVVMRLYSNIAQVIVGFDLPPCKVAAWADEQGVIRVGSAPSWTVSVKSMAFAIDAGRWGYASVLRVLKYHKKGFDVMVPGNYSSVRQDRSRCSTQPHNNVQPCLVTLLRASNDVMLGRQLRGAPSAARLSDYEFQKCVRTARYGTSSDYGMVVKLQGRLGHIINAVVGYGKRWFGYEPKPNHFHDPCAVEEPEYVWHACDPSKACMGMFCPADPKIHLAYDVDKLAELVTGLTHGLSMCPRVTC
jgi:Bifunctional DNA primase/polymerase, N-terminal